MQPLVAVPAIIALLYRAWTRNSLTPLGLVVAGLTAVVHAVHPWSVFFALLGVFFLGGTRATKVKHDIKARLTLSSSGSSGGEGPRTHVQVLANTLVASVLILIHAYTLQVHNDDASKSCLTRGQDARDVLAIGIIANYAAVAADTFSSELGILSQSSPRLITRPWKTVPRGTNGGVTLAGLVAGIGGAALIAVTSVFLVPFCEYSSPKLGVLYSGDKVAGPLGWLLLHRAWFVVVVLGIGLAGTLVDSLMGAVLQASVVDVRSGKIVEGEGGGKVPVHSSARDGPGAEGNSSGRHGHGGSVKSREKEAPPASVGRDTGNESRRVEVGWDVLSNNAVNLLMAATVSVLSMVAACWVWGVPLRSFIV